MLASLWSDMLELSRIEWVASLLALAYVILVARQKVVGWLFGIISCALWAYASLVFYKLYLDALLQVFYVAMGFWGWFSWQKDKTLNRSLSIKTLPLSQHTAIIVAGILLSLLFGYFFAAFTPAAATYPDAFTTVFAVAATLMQVKKVLENWIYWIVIDACYVWLYGSRGALLFMVLMLIYAIIATFAWIKWKASCHKTKFKQL